MEEFLHQKTSKKVNDIASWFATVKRMAAPKKFEERALTRQKTEDFIHEVVNYVAKHRRSQWTQLSDAGETTIILETDSTNLLPAIARQSRCYRIISDLDIPGNNEPQFHLRMTKPI